MSNFITWSDGFHVDLPGQRADATASLLGPGPYKICATSMVTIFQLK